jgi:DNA-binding NtrC family response regulator
MSICYGTVKEHGGRSRSKLRGGDDLPIRLPVPAQAMGERFLIIEDETTLRDSPARLAREGYEVEVAAGRGGPRPHRAAPLTSSSRTSSSRADGIELLEQARARPGQIVVVMTAYATLDTAVRALGRAWLRHQAGDPRELKRIVRSALRTRCGRERDPQEADRGATV